MPTETLVVGIPSDDHTTERVHVHGDQTEWTHDNTLLIYDDDTMVAEFPDAVYVARHDNLEG